jgi:hypothetical protein
MNRPLAFVLTAFLLSIPASNALAQEKDAEGWLYLHCDRRMGDTTFRSVDNISILVTVVQGGKTQQFKFGPDDYRDGKKDKLEERRGQYRLFHAKLKEGEYVYAHVVIIEKQTKNFFAQVGISQIVDAIDKTVINVVKAIPIVGDAGKAVVMMHQTIRDKVLNQVASLVKGSGHLASYSVCAYVEKGQLKLSVDASGPRMEKQKLHKAGLANGKTKEMPDSYRLRNENANYHSLVWLDAPLKDVNVRSK